MPVKKTTTKNQTKTAKKKTASQAKKTTRKKSVVTKGSGSVIARLEPGTPMTEALGESFLKDLIADWQSNGAGVIEECRTSKPEAYLRLIAAYAPKEFRKQVRPHEEISDDKLEEELKRALSELKNHGIETSPNTCRETTRKGA